MLLTEWTHREGLPIEAARATLDQVLRFVYGELYLIEMMDGRKYDDRDLDTVLGIMADEFRAHNTAILLRGGDVNKNGLFPAVELLDVTHPMKGPGIGKRANVQMVVSVVKGRRADALPSPDIDAVAQMVRTAVTMYSLTGEWTTFAKDNL